MVKECKDNTDKDPKLDICRNARMTTFLDGGNPIPPGVKISVGI